MSANISFEGQLFKGRITPAIQTALEDTKAFAAITVRGRTPVDTGNLKANWRFENAPQGIRFINDAPYAGFVELGTSKMAGRFMLSSSLPAIQEHFNKSLATEVGRRLAARLTVTDTGSLSYDNLTSRKAPGNSLLKRLRGLL